MSITGVYETVLSADDVAAATAFYADVLGLRLVDGPDELAAAFRLDEGGVLLIFDGRSLRDRDGRLPRTARPGPAISPSASRQRGGRLL